MKPRAHRQPRCGQRTTMMTFSWEALCLTQLNTVPSLGPPLRLRTCPAGPPDAPRGVRTQAQEMLTSPGRAGGGCGPRVSYLCPLWDLPAQPSLPALAAPATPAPERVRTCRVRACCPRPSRRAWCWFRAPGWRGGSARGRLGSRLTQAPLRVSCPFPGPASPLGQLLHVPSTAAVSGKGPGPPDPSQCLLPEAGAQGHRGGGGQSISPRLCGRGCSHLLGGCKSATLFTASGAPACGS